MRVLLTSQGYPPTVSGVTLVVQRLARALVQRGHTATVLAGSDRYVPYETYDHGVHIIRVASRTNPYWPANPFPSVSVEELERHIARERPDVIHAHDALPFCLQLVRARDHLSVPVVATCHFFPSFVASYLTHGEHTGSVVEDLTWRYSIALYNRMSQVVFATFTHRDCFVERGLETPTRVISNGVDIRRYSPSMRPLDLTQLYGIPPGPRVLAVGRLAKDKSLDVLIRAVARVRVVPARLLIVGEGPEREALEDVARRAGAADRVHFLGFVPEEELPALYRACDLFAISSNHEVQSLPALQAAATGLPIVAAAKGSLAEICHDGVNGILVRTDSPGDFAVAIAASLDSEIHGRMGDESLLIAMGHDERRTFDGYEGLYRDAMDAYPSTRRSRPHSFAVRVRRTAQLAEVGASRFPPRGPAVE